MEQTELHRLGLVLAHAKCAEEIFGQLQGTRTEKLASARRIFLQLAKAVHPDSYQDKEDITQAHLAFKHLARFWQQAQVRIEDGTYGTMDPPHPFKPFLLRSARGQYTLERLLTRGDLCNLYLGSTQGGQPVLLKVPRKPQDNDLVTNEARILRHLRASAGYEHASAFVSRLVDAFPYEECPTGMVRQVVVLAYVEGLISLKEIREAYPDGIDARDMAWIWRRLLVALDLAHSSAIIHGAVLPVHVLIEPAQHGVVLIDWSYAVVDPSQTHERIKAICADYRSWYPAEVFARQEPGSDLDLSMAARCMINLLGGNPREQTMPACVPWQIQHHLRGCLLDTPQQRPKDAGVLLAVFDELLERIWGPKRFHAFSMPAR